MQQDQSNLQGQVEPVLTLKVRFAGGGHHLAGAAAGFSGVELLRASGLPVKAECGGAGTCATCHVRVRDAWQALLPSPTDDELAKLDEIPGADEFSRLACQIVMTDALDGLELEIQADSIARPSLRATAG